MYLLNKKFYVVAIVFFTIATFALGQNQFLGKFNPNRKIPLEDLQYDFVFLQNALIEGHPGIYRYQTPEGMNTWFQYYYNKLTDSLTEAQFRILLTDVVDKIHCGHTDVFPSHPYERWARKMKPKLIPLKLAVQNDTLYVKDSLPNSTIPKGAYIVSINGHSAKNIIDTSLNFVTTDGYNKTFKYNIINTRMERFYRFLIDKRDTFHVAYVYNNRQFQTSLVAIKEDKKEESIKWQQLIWSKERPQTAILKLRAFKGGKQKRFLKRTFRKLQRKETQNLVIDLRNNGGGRIATATKLLSYIVDSTIKLECIRAEKKLSFYKKLSSHTGIAIINYFLKLAPHTIHECKRYTYLKYKIKKRHHYKGNVYLLVNGGSFSASCIVSSYLKGNQNVVIVGEETGGAMNGCNAFLLPKLGLPKTKLFVNFPLYQVNNLVKVDKVGRGVFPDYEVSSNYLSEKDLQLEKVYQLIQQNKK